MPGYFSFANRVDHATFRNDRCDQRGGRHIKRRIVHGNAGGRGPLPESMGDFRWRPLFDRNCRTAGDFQIKS
jgi:hypothetical protein